MKLSALTTEDMKMLMKLLFDSCESCKVSISYVRSCTPSSASSWIDDFEDIVQEAIDLEGLAGDALNLAAAGYLDFLTDTDQRKHKPW